MKTMKLIITYDNNDESTKELLRSIKDYLDSGIDKPSMCPESIKKVEIK